MNAIWVPNPYIMSSSQGFAWEAHKGLKKKPEKGFVRGPPGLTIPAHAC